MNFNNILTSDHKVLPVLKKIKCRPKKWQGLFNFKNLEKNLLICTPFVLNGCAIKKKKSKYVCYPLNYIKPLAQSLKKLDGLNLDIIESLGALESVEFNNVEELVFYMHLDLIMDYLEMDETIFLQERRLNFYKFYRPSVLEVNKYSFYLERHGTDVFYNKKVEDELIQEFASLKISSLELPMTYDLNKTLHSLKYFKDVMNSIKLPIKARKFNLKLKKLGIYKEDGFYSKEANTIIVDARNTSVFTHELGHLIYDNKYKINRSIKGSNSEEYAQNFAICVKSGNVPD